MLANQFESFSLFYNCGLVDLQQTAHVLCLEVPSTDTKYWQQAPDFISKLTHNEFVPRPPESRKPNVTIVQTARYVVRIRTFRIFLLPYNNTRLVDSVFDFQP